MVNNTQMPNDLVGADQSQQMPQQAQSMPSDLQGAGEVNVTSNTAPTGHHVTDTAFGQAQPGFNLRGAGNAIVSGVGGALEGAGEGVFSTISGAAHLANKVPGVHIPDKVTQGLDTLAGNGEEKNTAEKFGYGGETLGEFLLGDEALKGLTQSEKLLQTAKTMKILEKSPRTMMALKAGAQALRAGAVQAGQTEVRTGGDTHEALKQGGTMAAVAAPLGVVGEGLASIGEGITKGVEGQQALDYVAKQAQGKAVTTGELSDAIDASEQKLHSNYENTIKDFKTRLAGQELDPTDNTLPIAQKAKELLRKPVPPDHELVQDFKTLRGEKLDKNVRTILEKASTGYSEPVDFNKTISVDLPKTNATGQAPNQSLSGGSANKVTMNQFQHYDPTVKQFVTNPVIGNGAKLDLVDMSKIDPKDIDFTNGTFRGQQIPDDAIIHRLNPYDINSLIDLRQQARAASSEYPYGDVNSRTLRAFRDSIDDTIGNLAQKSNDPNLPQEYQALRADYQSKIHAYDDPIINNMREGKYGDATKEIMGGSNKMAPRLQQLETILGQPVMDGLRKDVFRTLLDNSKGPHGEVNPAQLLVNWGKIPEASRDTLFNKGVPASVMNDLMSSAKTARNLQYLSRVGVVAPLVASGGLFYHLGLIGALLGETGLGYGAAQKMGGIRQVIDYVADHPKMWKAWGLAGKALNPASDTVGTAIKGAVGQTVSGANQPSSQAKQNVYNGAAPGMTQNQ